MTSSRAKYQAYRARKSERYAKVGQDYEHEVADILERMLTEGAIDGYKHHRKWSHEDKAGKDFTVWRAGRATSFGVTISLRRQRRCQPLHPDVKQFCFPIGTKPETVRRRVLELLEESP